MQRPHNDNSLYVLARYVHRSGGITSVLVKALKVFLRNGPKGLLERVRELSRSGRAVSGACPALPRDTALSGLVFQENVPELSVLRGTVGIHLHLYYPDLAGEFAGYFSNIPYEFDLFVSVVDESGKRAALERFSMIQRCRRLTVRIVPNRGRDIAPMFCAFGNDLKKYRYLGHFHTKKSSGQGHAWRRYLLDMLLGSDIGIQKIFHLLEAGDFALAYPQTFKDMPPFTHDWLKNRELGTKLLHQLQLPAPPEGFDYPVGSMFWTQASALQPIFALNLQLAEFDEEAGQMDGTLAHALERVIGISAARHGQGHAILADPLPPLHNRWNLHKLARPKERMVRLLDDNTAISLVLFSLFDTLLLRPLASLQDSKLLAAALSASAGKIGDAEESMECTFARANPYALELLEHARKRGKRIGFADDTSLPRATLEKLLLENGIPLPDVLYLSNETGLRKDTGDLYRHILDRENLRAGQVLMIGDSPCLDAQVPSDLTMTICQLPRPSNMLLSVPAYAPLVRQGYANAQDSIAAGLIQTRLAARDSAGTLSASPPLFADLTEIGYSILGPLLVAFTGWLGRQASADGAQTLYFLARDGKILRRVYEKWRAAFAFGPPSEYCEVSRRAVSVPAIRNMEDVLAILLAPTSPTPLNALFQARLGFSLTPERQEELRLQGIWIGTWGEDGCRATLARIIEHLFPDILQQARQEEEALAAYFDSIGLAKKEPFALVDVGYSGTIQSCIAKLLHTTVRGYYMMTRASDLFTAATPASGFLGEGLGKTDALYTASLRLERLLTADEGQVARYRTGGGRLSVARVPLSEREENACEARKKLHEGLMGYVDDSMRIKRDILKQYYVSADFAREVYALLPHLGCIDSELPIDNFYCGQGLM